MKALNLYVLTQIQNEMCTKYENILSDRDEEHRIKQYEFESMVSLVEELIEKNVTVKELDGFYFSYSIEQIGKV
ncbi:MAG: hypothetical protein ACI4S2_04715 [Lachnospiraceae bacterium]